jgi:excisionase family DNA binding protein
MSTSKERGSARTGGKRSQAATKPTPPQRVKKSDTASSARPTAVDDAGLSEVRFLTVAEVASVMRVSKMTVYRLVHGGELPAVRVGRSFRVPDQAVHDYLRAAYIEAG